MQKILPYVFPSVAGAIVVLLAVRWYNLRAANMPQTMPFAQDVAITELSKEAATSFLRSASDLDTVELQPVSSDATGEVRYEVQGSMLTMSVVSLLPDSKNVYQVWFKDQKSGAVRKAFALESSKGGYSGSATIPTSLLPFDIVISSEADRADNMPETIVLEGTLTNVE